jgi:hypothetical protein
MRKDETIKKNIGATFDFIRYLIDTPEALEGLPDKSTIDFLEMNEPLPTPTSPRRPNDRQPTVVFRVGRSFSRLQP